MSTTPSTNFFRTTCPACHTRFKINEAQLQARQGQVRCGSCGQIFNAKSSLEKITPPPVAKAPPVSSPLEAAPPPVPSKKEEGDTPVTKKAEPPSKEIIENKTKNTEDLEATIPPRRRYQGFASSFAEEQKQWGENPPPLEANDLSNAFRSGTPDNTGEFDFDSMLNGLRADKLAKEKNKEATEQIPAALMKTEAANDHTPSDSGEQKPVEEKEKTTSHTVVPLKKPKQQETPAPIVPPVVPSSPEIKAEAPAVPPPPIEIPKKNTLPQSIQDDDLFSTIEFEAIPIEDDEEEEKTEEQGPAPDFSDDFEGTAEKKDTEKTPLYDLNLDLEESEAKKQEKPALDFSLDFDEEKKEAVASPPDPALDSPLESSAAVDLEEFKIESPPQEPISPELPPVDLAKKQEDPLVFVSVDTTEEKQTDPKRKYWLILSVVSSFILLFQSLFFFRMDLINLYPTMKPFFETSCGIIGCDMDPPRVLEQLAVVGSDMEQAHVNATDMVTLHITLANHAAYAVTFPSIMLELSNNQGQVVGRRFVHPTEYLNLNHDLKVLKRGLPSKQETQVQIHLKLNQLQAINYHIELFYPLP